MKPSQRINEITNREVRLNRENPLPGRPPVDLARVILMYLDEEWEKKNEPPEADFKD